jgi:uncharacterized protein with NAD-binding domain and iron-sulfur cluster
VTTRRDGKRKVAVLGGGVASIVTAYRLARDDHARALEITVYQMGHRLGGKCASGRAASDGQRNEEHGIHLLFGSYEAIWDVLAELWSELDRPASHPLATLDRCFLPQGQLCMAERSDGRVSYWPFYGPPRGEHPWLARERRGGGRAADPWGWPALLAEALEGWLGALVALPATAPAPEGVRRFLTGIWSVPRDAAGKILIAFEPLFVETRAALGRLWDLARELVATIAAQFGEARTSREHDGALDALLGRLEALVRSVLHGGWARYLRMLFLIHVATVRGLLRDRPRTWDDLDDLDLREWLTTRGGLDAETAAGPCLELVYQTSFCYRDGAREQPSYAAGVALYTIARTLFDYQGAWGYYFRAPTGDVLFEPFYELLRRKYGVRFRFFHRVRAVVPEGDRVERLELDVQARVRAGVSPQEGTNYDPLVEVRGLAAWPSEPRWELLDDEARLRGHDFESYWDDVEPVERKTLVRGRDFDDVVLGISVAALPIVAPALVAASPRWRAMIEAMPTVATANCQLFTKRTPDQLGAPRFLPGQQFAVCGDAWPLANLADYSQQAWCEDPEVRGIVYASIAWPTPSVDACLAQADFPQVERERFYETCKEWFERYLGDVLPGLVTRDDSGGRALAHDELVAPARARGEERLRAQFYRVNVDPTERYVLSIPGSTRHRLAADESGYRNLFLCGDWTRTRINSGSVEAATLSAIACAAAVRAALDARSSG